MAYFDKQLWVQPAQKLVSSSARSKAVNYCQTSLHKDVFIETFLSSMKCWSYFPGGASAATPQINTQDKVD